MPQGRWVQVVPAGRRGPRGFEGSQDEGKFQQITNMNKEIFDPRPWICLWIFQLLTSDKFELNLQMPLSYADPGANLVLKKVSEEGLELVLGSEKSRATATVVYKVRCKE